MLNTYNEVKGLNCMFYIPIYHDGVRLWLYQYKNGRMLFLFKVRWEQL